MYRDLFPIWIFLKYFHMGVGRRAASPSLVTERIIRIVCANDEMVTDGVPAETPHV